MTAGLPLLACPNCRTLNPPGARYCQRCGEAVDPALVAGLQLNYTILQDLDRRIAAGQSATTVAALRDEIRARYLAERGQPGDDSAIAPAKAAELRFFYAWLLDLEARVTGGEGDNTVQTLRDAVAARYSAERRAEPSAQGAVPPGGSLQAYPTYAPPPVAPRARFSWREFLSDQAIAIVLYLGALLALVATLTFVLTTSATFSNYIRFGAVAGVYVLFGLGAFELRRRTQLRSVGNVFLVIFALMTPVVALALYILVLSNTVNGTQAVLTISAFYAACVYLFLTWRTEFKSFAYLGWVSFGLGVVALGSWVNLPAEYVPALLSSAGIGMLLPTFVEKTGPGKAIAPAGRITAIVATTIAGLVLLVSVVIYVVNAFTRGEPNVADALRQATLVGSAAFLILTLLWTIAVRRGGPTPGSGQVVFADTLAALAVANTALVASVYAGFDRLTVAYVLQGVALAEFAFAQVVGRARGPLRWAVSSVAMALTLLATALTLGFAEPAWARSGALGVGLLIAVVVAIRERAPWWLLAAGGFVLVAFASLDATLQFIGFWDTLGQISPEFAFLSTHFALLALALVAIIFVVRSVPGGRRYSWPIYITAITAAATASALLVLGGSVNGVFMRPDWLYQTGVLALFTLLALALGRLERQPLAGNLVSGAFALFLPLPLLARGPDPLIPILVTLAFGALTIGARLAFGRTYTYALYFTSVWLTLFTASYAQAMRHDPDWLAPTHLTLAAILCFAMALLATISALLERHDAVMIAPAALALLGVLFLPDATASTFAVLGMVGMGSLVYALRQRYADIPWHSGVALGTIVVGGRLATSDPNGYALSIGLCAIGVATFSVAIQRRRSPTLQGIFLAAAAFYLTLAVLGLPAAQGFLPAAIYAVALAVISVPLRVWAARRWAAPLYGSALASSLVSLSRVNAFDLRTVGLLLALYAVVALPIAIVERDARINIIPALYALAAVIVEPDALPFLGFTVAFLVVAMALGRWRGGSWSIPWYLVAGFAILPTFLRHTNDLALLTLSLGLLAALWYLAAVVESRATLLIVGLALGVFAVLAAGAWLAVDFNLTVLAISALAVVYWGLQWLWRALPGLRADHDGWYTGGYLIAVAPKAPPALPGAGEAAVPAKPLPVGGGSRPAGMAMHRRMAVLASFFAFGLGWLRHDAFTPWQANTLTTAATLFVAGALLLLIGLAHQQRVALYFAGVPLSLGLAWVSRYLGVDNVQGYVLWPGSYLILLGALLPADKRVRQPSLLAPWASIAGALVLLLPTFTQTFSSGQELLYLVVLATEALLLVGIGVGTKTRLLIFTGTAFIGLGAIRGAALAVAQGVPVFALFAALAVVLLGGGAWLTIRQGRAAPKA